MIPQENRKLLEKNLNTLAQLNSSLANKLRKISFPDDLKFIPATDGYNTAFSSVLSRSGWLAGTSAPSIRESVIIENFSPGNANILLAGTGQGFGIKLLLEKLEPYQAIFVWEQNLLSLTLTLSLYDFSNAIKTSRLVFLTESDLKQCLQNYFIAHPEFAFPVKVIHWPWLSEKKIQEISLTIEQAFTDITRKHSEKMSELENLLAQKAAQIDSQSTLNKIFIISFAHTPEHFRFAKSLATAARTRNVQVETYLFDTPKHGTHLALLEELVSFAPDNIVLIATAKNNVPFKLPDTIRTTSILSLPNKTISQEQLERLQICKNEKIIVGSESDAKFLQNHISADKIYYIKIAVDDISFVPIEQTPEFDIAIFANKPDDNPEKYGVRQNSHKKLWHALADAISKQAIEFSVDKTEQFVKNACKATGVEFNDEELFDSFASIVKQALAPSSVVSTITGKIIHSDLKTRIFGVNQNAQITHIPDEPSKLNKILNSAKIILVIDIETNWKELVFDAVCAGKIVVVKPLSNDNLSSFTEIANAIRYLNSQQNIITQIKNIIANYEQSKSSVNSARKFLADNYSFRKIIEIILDKT